MKRRFLSLVILTLAIVSASSSLAQNSIDPACIETCRLQLFQCRSAATDQGAERLCIAQFRACKAQCPGANSDVSARCAVP